MKTVLCFGDSNTYGLIPGTKDRYEESVRWTGLLADKVRNKGYRVVEEGLVGRTTIFSDDLRPGRKGSDLLPVLLESHGPVDTVVLMLGTNDCKTVYSASAEVIGRGIEKLLDQIRSFGNGIRVILVSPILLGEEVWKIQYDPEFGKASVEVSKELKRVYQQISEKYGCEFLAASDVADPSDDDQEHLTPAGHAAIATAILKVISGKAV